MAGIATKSAINVFTSVDIYVEKAAIAKLSHHLIIGPKRGIVNSRSWRLSTRFFSLPTLTALID